PSGERIRCHSGAERSLGGVGEGHRRSSSRRRLCPLTPTLSPQGRGGNYGFGLAALLFLDVGGVEQGGHNGCRADANGHSCFHQLVAALLVGAVGVVVAVGHRRLSMASGAL